MDTRYVHPMVEYLWSPTATYDMWRAILLDVMAAQANNGILNGTKVKPGVLALTLAWSRSIGGQEIQTIRDFETVMKHDVAAFLKVMRADADLRGVNPAYVGWGLTSSDLVETAQGMRFRDLSVTLGSELGPLFNRLRDLENGPILGRTHGQIAEPMTMQARSSHWSTLLAYACVDLMRSTRRMRLCKLSGPVGTFAHNPPVIEAEVAAALDLEAAGDGASQIIPRSALAAWANAAAAVVEATAKIAIDIRLMTLLGETKVPFTEGQVGSSSMAHKRNPVQAEQIAGLARMARGYALMLSPVDNWLERDISMSCVERVAVPDLWHVLFHAIHQTTAILGDFTLNKDAINKAFDEASVQPLVMELTLDNVLEGKSWEEARRQALKSQLRIGDPVQAANHSMRNYPGATRVGE